jgi:hypothetical protein
MVPTEAEQAVLGDCLIDREAIAHVAPILTPTDFSEHRHRVIYTAMLSLWKRGVPIDDVTFPAELCRTPGYLDIEVAESYVVELKLATPASVHAIYHAELVKTYSLQRRLELAVVVGDLHTITTTAQQLQRLQQGASAEPRFRLYTAAELDELPDPEYLVERILTTDTLAELYGDAASYKTFVALSMGLSIAAGHAWHGRRVKPGRVVYVVSEGARGFKKRIHAWELHHQRAAPDTFHVLADTVRVLDTGDVEAFCTLLQELPDPPILIVLDTLSRALDGGDENAPADMGKAIAAMDRIRLATSACVLVLHHGTKDGKWSRGHSSLRGALQTEIEAVRDTGSGGVVLHCRKQKDDDSFPPIALLPRRYEIDDEQTSIVLLPTDYCPPRPAERPERTVALDILDAAGAAGLGHNEWVRRIVTQTGKSDSTAKRIIIELKDHGLVNTLDSGNYHRIEATGFTGVNWGQTGVMTPVDPGVSGFTPLKGEPTDPTDPTLTNHEPDPWDDYVSSPNGEKH